MGRIAALGTVLVVAAAGSGATLAARGAASPEQVVRAWSRSLNADDNKGAARLFALNAHVVQPGVDVVLDTRAIAVAFNASLPCAGKVTKVTVQGDRAVATFVLGERPKHRCDAPGQKAAALFVVRNGEITLWEQVPVPNPDAGQPTA